MKIKYINWSTAIFPGFYESELYNSDTLYNITANDDDHCEFDFVDGGFEKYCADVSAQAADALFYCLDDADAIRGIKFLALHSPRFYNFETDKIECEIDCDWPKIVEFAKSTQRETFDQYLHENFTSRDGFWSFVPNNVGEFFVCLDTDFERLSDVLLEYYILQHLDRDRYLDYLFEIGTNTIWNYITEIKGESNGNTNNL